MSSSRSSLLILAVSCLGSVVRAEAPAVTAIFPAGVQHGQTATVTLIGKTGTQPLEVWTSRDDVVFAETNKPAEWTITAANDAPPGSCWVRLFNADGANELKVIQVGTLSETTEVEPNDKLTDAHEIPNLPVTLNGQLNKSEEVDVYAVNLEAGQTLIASVDAHRSLGSPMDPVLQLLSSRGFVLQQIDDHHGNDPRIVFTAVQAGTYFLRLFAFPADPNSTIAFSGAPTYVYRLTLTTGPFVNHVWPLVVSNRASNLPAVRGWNLPTEPLTLSWMNDHQRHELTSPFLTSLTLDRLSRVDHAALLEEELSKDAMSSLPAIPLSVSGTISALEETDIYTFAGKKGQALTISADAHPFDSPLDPLLKVFGPDGKLLQEADDESRDDNDAHATVTLPEDGNYRIELRDRFGHGDPWSVYLLTIDELIPRYELTMPVDPLTLTAGPPKDKPLTLTVTVNRIGGFNEDITIRLHGLPESMQVPAQISQSSGDTSKSVTFTLQAPEEVQFSGPIRVMGTVESGTTIIAQAPAPIEGLYVDSLWLTVVAPSP